MSFHYSTEYSSLSCHFLGFCFWLSLIFCNVQDYYILAISWGLIILPFNPVNYYAFCNCCKGEDGSISAVPSLEATLLPAASQDCICTCLCGVVLFCSTYQLAQHYILPLCPYAVALTVLPILLSFFCPTLPGSVLLLLHRVFFPLLPFLRLLISAMSRIIISLPFFEGSLYCHSNAFCNCCKGQDGSISAFPSLEATLLPAASQDCICTCLSGVVLFSSTYQLAQHYYHYLASMSSTTHSTLPSLVIFQASVPVMSRIIIWSKLLVEKLEKPELNGMEKKQQASPGVTWNWAHAPSVA